jgi:hypothetical protein
MPKGKINRFLILLKSPLCGCQDYAWALQDGPGGQPKMVVWCQTCNTQTTVAYQDMRGSIATEPKTIELNDSVAAQVTDAMVVELLRKTKFN